MVVVSLTSYDRTATFAGTPLPRGLCTYPTAAFAWGHSTGAVPKVNSQRRAFVGRRGLTRPVSVCARRVAHFVARRGHWQACRDADACARPTSPRSRKAAAATAPQRAGVRAGDPASFAATSVIAFWLLRISTGVSSRVRDVLSSELIVDAEAAGYERRILSRPQRPRPEADTPTSGRPVRRSG